MPTGPTRRRPQTNARLLDAAFEVFAERGFSGPSIEEICERAGYTRGAFYSNYTSKGELFFALFDRHARRVIERFNQVVAEATDAEDPLHTVIDRMSQLDADEQRWYVVSTEFTLYAIRNPDAARVLAEHERHLRHEIVRLLEVLFERTDRRPIVDLESLARLVTAIREGSLAQSLVEPEQAPPGKLERTFLPFLLRAVSLQNRRRGPATPVPLTPPRSAGEGHPDASNG